MTAQQSDFQGKIEYNFDYNLNKIKKYSSDLIFNQSKSIFYWNDTADQSSASKDDFGNISFDVEIKDSIGTINITDFSKDSIVTRTLWIKGKTYLINEKIAKINWKLLNEQKKIGNFLCSKANCSFRGRNYTVWYTNQIPLPIGPWKLQGLPGAILEARDETGEIYFAVKKVTIPYPITVNTATLEGEKISLKDFVAVRKELLNTIVKTFKSKLPRGVNATLDSSQENYLENSFEFEQ